MNTRMIALGLSASLILAASSLFAEDTLGRGRAYITMVNKDAGDPPALAASNLQIRVDGKPATVAGIARMAGPRFPVEMILIIDGDLRNSIGTQLETLKQFAHDIPDNTKIAIAYVENGHTVLAGPFTSDPATAQAAVRLPTGTNDSNASIYTCLSDLAKGWPSKQQARRMVLLISAGIDTFNPHFDPDDSYMLTASADAVRAGIVVSSIYWSGAWFWNTSGQTLMQTLSQATGGASYEDGTRNAVSIAPHLQDFLRQLNSQYMVVFTAPFKGKADVYRMQVKVDGVNAKIYLPNKVFMLPAPAAPAASAATSK